MKPTEEVNIMRKMFWIVVAVVVTSAAFGQTDYDPAGDGGNPVSELDGKRQQKECKGLLRQSYALTDEANREEVAGHRDRAVYLRNIAVTKVTTIKQALTPAEFVALQKEVNSGPATWGKSEYDAALKSGLIVGRTAGATSNSNECQDHATREEVVTVGNRAVKKAVAQANTYTDTQITAHDNSPQAHAQQFEEAKTYTNEKSRWGIWAFWALVALLALLLLLALLRRRGAGAVAVYPAPGMAVPVVVVPGAPGVLAPAAGAPVVPPAFVPYNRGVGQQVVQG